MFWTYFFMLLLFGLAGTIAKASGEFYKEGDGAIVFWLSLIGEFLSVTLAAAVITWADAIDILARFGA